MRRLRRLVQKRSLRWREGICVLEGPDLVEAALAAGAEFEAVYVDAGSLDEGTRALIQRARARGVRVMDLAPGVLEKVADATTPQPVVATVRLPTKDLAQVTTHQFILVLHDVRDPGNAGTLIRSSAAAGADAVFVTGDAVDPCNPKTLRATAGAIFHVPVVVTPWATALEWLHARDVRVLASVVRGGEALNDVDFSLPTAVVVGNEAHGLSTDVVESCDAQVSITMVGPTESLNAAVAGSLIAFAALGQREGRPGASPTPSL